MSAVASERPVPAVTVRREGSRDRLRLARDVLAPQAVFALLFWISAGRWITPFQDHGREVMTALRLATGELLYRDVGSYYGPLPPLLDALALRLLGVHLDALVAVRTLFAILGVEAIRRLALRLGVGSPLASAIAAAVTAIAFFAPPGPVPFPYSVAALEGTVWTLWALELALGCRSMAGAFAAAALAGLAAGTKVEFLPAALAGLGLALFLRRPGKETVASLGFAGLLASLAWGVPLATVGVDQLSRHGFLIARENPVPWRSVYESIAFGGMSARAFLAGGFLEAAFPSVLFLGCSFFLLFAVKGREAVVLPAALLLGLSSLAIEGNEELHALLLVAWLIAAFTLFAALRAGRTLRASPVLVAQLAASTSMVFLLLRQPFFLRMGSYLPAAAPLALVVSVAFAGRRLPSPSRLTFFLCGIVAAQVTDRWNDYRSRPLERFSFARGEILVPPSEARFLREAIAVIDRWSRPGDLVAGLPETGFLLYASDRRSPFVDELFYPGNQDAVAEDEMIRALESKPVRLVLVADRPFPEYGQVTYRRGVLDRFFRTLDGSFVRVGDIRTNGPESSAIRRTARRAEVHVSPSSVQSPWPSIDEAPPVQMATSTDTGRPVK